MAGAKLKRLKQEIDHYLGIPYFSNTQKLPKDNIFVGKGNWQEIKSFSDNYYTLKKNHIGIDCSGLAVNLLNFYFNQNLDVRKTSANMLTSSPLAIPVTNYHQIKTADLIRQKNGHHVLFIIEKKGETLYCIDSSLRGRGVRHNQIKLQDKPEIFRLTFPQPTRGT